MIAITDAPTPLPVEAEVPGVRAARRLRPLYLAALVGGFALWVPVEKLFMSEIGFDAATVGLMAGVYAMVVPLLEVPSGILADRWSRKGVLVAANVALFASVLVCGLAANVTTYVVGAGFIGAYIALHSGTLDSMVYDALQEELGGDATFESTIGRFRAVESMALAAGAVGGGLLAAVTSPRVTYFATLPFLALSVVLIGRFREPSLHQDGEREPLRQQIATTYRTVVDRGNIRPIVALMVLTGVLVQAMLEFGPLWMVALGAPVLLYGAHWAGLTGALGVGGLLAGRLHLECRTTLATLGGLMVGAAVAMTASRNLAVIVTAQVTLVLVVMVLSVHLTGLLHSSIPSTIRAGVSSGVSTLTWLVFLPFSLVFGVVADRVGVNGAGWLVVGFTAAAAVVTIRLVAPSVKCHPVTATA